MYKHQYKTQKTIFTNKYMEKQCQTVHCCNIITYISARQLEMIL
jgi:hypothetical protein